MNCQDIGRILNDDDIATLSPAVARRVREHHANCDDCAWDWKVHERMLAMPTPAPGPRLLGWQPEIRAADTLASARRPLRNSLIFGMLIAVGAAAAVFVVAERRQDPGTAVPLSVQSTSNDASSHDDPVGTPRDSLPVVADESKPPVTRAFRPGYAYAFTAVLAPSRQDPQDAEMLMALEAALLDKLRSMPHLILIEPESFDQYLEPNGLPRWPLPEGIDFLVQLQRSSRLADIEALTGQWNFEVRVWKAGDNRIAGATTALVPDTPLSTEIARAVIEDLFEERLRDNFPPEDLSRLAEIRNMALDPTRLERDRLAALDELEAFAYRFGIFDESVQQQVSLSIAHTATEIVTTSPDPAVRARLWDVVSGLAAPYLVAPLAESLQRDPNDAVRIAAARRLALSFADDPVARAALDFAALNDRSRSIRHYARWANSDEFDRQALLAEMLADPAVPQAERSSVVRSDIGSYASYITRESAELLLAIAAAAPVNMAWSDITSDLGSAPPQDVVPLLLERLRDDPDAAIRRVAAGALLGHQDQPGVVEALRNARDNDPSPEVRLAAFTVR